MQIFGRAALRNVLLSEINIHRANDAKRRGLLLMK